MRLLRFWLASLLVVGLGGAGCSTSPLPSASPSPIVWRFAIEETSGSVQDLYARGLSRKVEAASGGTVTVQVYPYGTLGTSDQLTELLYNGSLQLAMASPGHLGKIIPEVQVLLLHYVFDSDERVNREVLASPRLLGAFDRLYAEKEFQLLAMFSEGWQVWTTQRPVRQPADFRGMKFRVMTSPLLLAAYEAYGASATPLPYSDVYSGLQLKMIDGQVNPLFAIEEMSFHEVSEVLTVAGQAPFLTSCVANRDFYQGLSDEQRGWLDGAVREMDGEIFEIQTRLNAERLQTILKERPALRVVTLEEGEREAFRQASLPVRDLYRRAAGPRGAALLQILLDEVERVRGEVGEEKLKRERSQN